jgi:hypothetical protein
MTLLASDSSIYIEYCICCCIICAKNERSMQKQCCHSCLLPNVIVGRILWPVMSQILFEYITRSLTDSVRSWHSHKAGTWSSYRKSHICDDMEPDRLRYCRQTPKWYENEQWLCCEKHTHFTWTRGLSSKNSATWRNSKKYLIPPGMKDLRKQICSSGHRRIRTSLSFSAWIILC